MGKLSSGSWFGRVRSSTKHNNNKKKKGSQEPDCGPSSIGVLALEIASLMSKTVHLWHSLGHDHIDRLKHEVFRLEGVQKLVSDDSDFLSSLALAEVVDSLRFLSEAVARLGARCADPLLQRFDRVFAHLVRNEADLYGFEYAGKKMERKAKKMERLVSATSKLYQELEVLAELEQTLRRMQVQAQAQAHSDRAGRGCLSDFKHKVVWRRQEVKNLRDASVWNRTHDYAVRLLARSLFTVVGRIRLVFGFGFGSHHIDVVVDDHDDDDDDELEKNSRNRLTRSRSVSVSQTGSPLPHPWKQSSWKEKKNKWAVSSRSFNSCMVMGGPDSPVLPKCIPFDAGFQMASAAVPRSVFGAEDVDYFRGHGHASGSTSLYQLLIESRHKSLILKPPPSTLGAAALALHYANVIIVIEKLAGSPHFIGADARDDLYYMLPTSIKAALRARLKSYAKNYASSFYDPNLATEWSEAITRILDWLAPLAHNMIRWQSERNFEQQNLDSSTILLLQTLHFANQAKTEAAVTELLVGLNYLWRFRRELNAKSVSERVSSRNFGDFLDLKC